MKKIIFLMLILCAFFCASPGVFGAACTIDGTVTLPAVSTAKSWSLIVDTDMNGGNGFVTATGGLTNGTNTYTYSISVEEGTYYIYSIVDEDSSGGAPNSGDYVAVYGALWPSVPGAANAVFTCPTGATFDMTAGTLVVPTATPTPTPGGCDISGTVTLPAASSGQSWVVLVDNDMDGSNGWVAAAGGTTDGTNHYSYTVSAGPGIYYIYTIVDENASGGPPDNGDYVGFYGTAYPTVPGAPNASFTCPAGGTFDITAVLLQPTPTPTVGGCTIDGTVTLPASSSGKDWYVIVDNDTDGGNGWLANDTGTTAGTNQFTYSISIGAGTYYIYAVVDEMATGMPEGPQGGDYIGYYGVVFPSVPAAPNAVVGPCPGGGTFDITAGIIPTPTPTPTYTLTASPTGTATISLNEAVDNYSLTWDSQDGWYGQQAVSYYGGDAAESGPLSDTGFNILQSSVTGPGRLSFYWRALTDAGDPCIFVFDSFVNDQISGDTGWVQKTVDLTEDRPYPFFWEYDKDGITQGMGSVWVDRIEFTYYSPTVTLTVTNTPADTATNTPVDTATNTPVDTVTNTATNTPMDTATNSPTRTPTPTSTQTISVPEAVDNFTLAFTYGGNANWFGQTAYSNTGGDAARSGAIFVNQSTWFETTVTGPGTVTFYWSVSSETGGDFLSFRDNAAQQDLISGTLAWTQVSYNVPAGSHTLRWVYDKDGGASAGSDCGWVDNIVYVPATPTDTPTFIVTDTPSATASVTPTVTNTNSPTFTVTDTPAFTETPSLTLTLTSTLTDTPIDTATNTPVDTPTDTPVSTATDTPVNTATETPVNTITDTPVNTPTDTPVATATSTGSAVPSQTDTPAETATSTPVNTATHTLTLTHTPIYTPTITPTRGQPDADPGGSYCYPQPASTTLRIVYSLPGPEVVTIKIYNFAGTPVAEFEDSGAWSDDNSIDIELTKFAPGIYYYLIKRSGVLPMKGKFLVVK